MREYRQRSNSDNSEQAIPVVNTGGCAHENVPVCTLLASYGIPEDDMDIGALGESAQTVEQEYQSYVLGVLSSRTLDILKFWEVMGNFLFFIWNIF